MELLDDKNDILKTTSFDNIKSAIERADKYIQSLNTSQKKSLFESHGFLNMLKLLAIITEDDELIQFITMRLQDWMQYVSFIKLHERHQEYIYVGMDNENAHIQTLIIYIIEKGLKESYQSVFLDSTPLLCSLISGLGSSSISFAERLSEKLLQILDSDQAIKTLNESAVHDAFEELKYYDEQLKIRLIDFLCKLSLLSLAHFQWAKSFGLLNLSLHFIRDLDPLLSCNVIGSLCTLASSSTCCLALYESKIILELIKVLPMEDHHRDTLSDLRLPSCLELISSIAKSTTTISIMVEKGCLLKRLEYALNSNNKDIKIQVLLTIGDILHYHKDLLKSLLLNESANILNLLLGAFFGSGDTQVAGMKCISNIFRTLEKDYPEDDFLIEKFHERACKDFGDILPWTIQRSEIPIIEIQETAYDLLYTLTKYCFILKHSMVTHSNLWHFILDRQNATPQGLKYRYAIIEAVYNHPNAEAILGKETIDQMSTYLSEGVYFVPAGSLVATESL